MILNALAFLFWWKEHMRPFGEWGHDRYSPKGHYTAMSRMGTSGSWNNEKLRFDDQ